MRRPSRRPVVILALAALVLAALPSAASAASPEPAGKAKTWAETPDTYIVTFDGPPGKAAERAIEELGELYEKMVRYPDPAVGDPMAAIHLLCDLLDRSEERPLRSRPVPNTRAMAQWRRERGV